MARIGVSFSLQLTSDTDSIRELTVLADQLGYDSVWIPEAWGRDAFTLLAALSVHTERIKLATGIVNVFSRTPAVVAQSIVSLDDLSSGRAILGLGASGPRVIERWHGLKFNNVLERTKEFVEVVKLIISGGRVDYEGQVYQIHDFSLAFKPPRPTIPIFLAAIGPANIRLAGEVADGWLPIFASSSFLAQGDVYLTDGRKRADRPVSAVTVASYVPALVGRRGPELLKRHIAFYVGAMGSYYYRLMVRSGWEKEANAIRESWRAGSRTTAASLVSDHMVQAIGITGDAAQVRARIQDFRNAGLDLPILTFPWGAELKDIRATLEALGG